MKRTLTLFTALAMLPLAAHAEDPFAAGADALAVKDSDGSSSLRAKMKLAKMEPDMIQVEVKGLDDSKYPNCVMQAKVIVAAESKDKHFKLMAKNKVYPFAPVLKMKGKQVNLKDEMTQNNLGACYYPPKTKLIVKVSGVDLKTKQFTAAAIYLK
jgi:hypothetical protein